MPRPRKFARRFRPGLAFAMAAAHLALAQDAQTPNQQPLTPAAPLQPEAPVISQPAKDEKAPADNELPANPSPTDPDQPLLPQEMLLMPPTPRPPGSIMIPSSDEPFTLRTPPPIEPLLPPLTPELAGGTSLASSLHVFVKGFRFQGNKVYSNRQLQKEVAKYAGREISGEELEEARQAITLKYVKGGYINSGATLPDQDLKGGIVIFKIVEGRISKIDLQGNWWFRPWWLKHALYQAAGRPLNFDKLKTGLQLLRQTPGIRQINAELEPGGLPGESILKAEVKEVQPFRLSLELSNKRPPSVGSEILEAHAADLNFTGHNDPLSVTWGLAHSTSETPDHWAFSGSDNLAGSYEIPITPWKTTLEGHASKSDVAIVEEPFTLLNIKSRTEEYGFTIKQPLYESLNNALTFSLTGEERQSTTFLLEQPFDLSPGSINGKTRLFVLRFAVEYLNRSQVHVFAFRSTINWGIDAFHPTLQNGGSNTTTTGTGQFQERIPDGRFVSWLGQAQYVRRLFNTDTLAVLRLNAQLAHDPLVPLEQFSLGGAQSVRGYRENELLRDNGVFASLELRTPLLRDKAKNPVLTAAPFFDFGAGWDTVDFLGPQPPSNLIDRHKQTLYSIGAGLIYTPNKYFSAQLYWGYALNRTNVVPNGRNLQDYGLHFVMSLNAF